MYEVVWLRMMTRVTGVTIYATATVVAAFMCGLAVGSFILGWRIDKRHDPLRVYAVLELLIACAAFLVPFLFSASTPLYRYTYGAFGENFVTGVMIKGAVSFLSLLIPTIMMGGTLPVLTSCLVKNDNLFGKNFSILYGLNTLGAVCGVLLSGFITIGELGEWATIYIAASINLAVAMVALSVHLNSQRPRVEDDGVQDLPNESVGVISPYSDGIRRAVLVGLAISGFTALAYEVIWTRQLILFLRTSIYAFSGMLAVFLTGIALGSLTMNKIVEKLKIPLTVFGVLELIVGFLSILNLYAFSPLDGLWFQHWLGPFYCPFAALVIVFPMTFIFGMIFPIAGKCSAKSVAKTGRSVGWLYGSNTVGGILGSLLAGFLLIPIFGSTKTIIVLACLNVVLGSIFLLMEPKRSLVRKLALVPLLAVFVGLTVSSVGDDPFLKVMQQRIYGEKGIKGSLEGTEIFMHKEGIEGTVTVYSRKHQKAILVNGMGMTELCTETKLMAHLPLMFAKDPKEMLVICFGMGTTVKSAALYPGLNITAVELVQEAFDSFGYFHPGGEGILKRDNIRLITNDGRNHLLFTSKKYDVITVDPAPPIWAAGTVNLYTREFFQLCKDHLNTNGAMCLWFPGGSRDDDLAILRTFSEVFPETSVWKGPRGWGAYLIGTIRAMPWAEFRRNAEQAFAQPAIVRDLSEYNSACSSVDKLYALQKFDANQVKAYRSGGVLITDDFPFTEFFLWRVLMRHLKFAK